MSTLLLPITIMITMDTTPRPTQRQMHPDHTANSLLGKVTTKLLTITMRVIIIIEPTETRQCTTSVGETLIMRTGHTIMITGTLFNLLDMMVSVF